MSTLLPLARVHKRPLQREVADRVQDVTDYKQQIQLGSWFISVTQPWMDLDWLKSSVPIRPLAAVVYLHTDASKAGWGGHTDVSTVEGLWTMQEAAFHINLLEMEAVSRCLKRLVSSLRGRHVKVCGDNSACLSYLRKQGGTVSRRMSLKAEEILLWAHTQGISISTEFVPGKLNVLADLLSRRNQVLPTEWTIAHHALVPVWDLWGKPHIDLFATHYNTRLPLYVSPMRDPLALGRDAFSMPWTNLLVYAYPPTALIPKVLAKWSVDRPRMILVAPFWTGAPWFPDLVALAQPEFLHLRLDHRTLVQPRSGIGHANVHVLRLTAWLLSPLS